MAVLPTPGGPINCAQVFSANTRHRVNRQYSRLDSTLSCETELRRYEIMKTPYATPTLTLYRTPDLWTNTIVSIAARTPTKLRERTFVAPDCGIQFAVPCELCQVDTLPRKVSAPLVSQRRISKSGSTSDDLPRQTLLVRRYVFGLKHFMSRL